MKTQQAIDGILSDYGSQEIEERLNEIFNGYLGSDNGHLPQELQLNHLLIRSIINMFRACCKECEDE
ncbi:hypothetical protein D0T50_03510 [Bacteroides sp. 214]|uniref:hypothetical protein n=1 Tax=Bacteroides sp. 214 TaxID=2302935 RepID=UPI0013D157CE|nr:hypothetical protein [Bacteroides sp. 214]NDW11956.1 hypothetical protein [Bacteroides sp. 214]